MDKELAFFGGNPLFDRPKSTSNLVQPSKQLFKKYLRNFVYEKGTFFQENLMLIEFEKRFAKLHDVKHCIPVVNGLWALVISINELKLKGKSEIIMPSLTYRRMADIAAWVGLTPRFCDINEDNFAVSRDNIAKCINSDTALVLAPHPIVNICDVYGISELCNQHNLPLLFDSVEAYYADIQGERVGSFGRAECFSLHASKFLNGFEGGYITTNDDTLARKLRLAINKGEIHDNKIIQFGLDLHMPNYHAAMAVACLDNIEEQVIHNKKIYQAYFDGLEAIDELKLIEYNNDERRSFKNILIELKDDWPISRELLIKLLHAENLIVRPYYTPPLHEMERSYPTIFSSLPNTDYWKTRLLLMPCGHFVSVTDVKLIINLLLEIRANQKKIIKKYGEG